MRDRVDALPGQVLGKELFEVGQALRDMRIRPRDHEHISSIERPRQAVAIEAEEFGHGVPHAPAELRRSVRKDETAELCLELGLAHRDISRGERDREVEHALLERVVLFLNPSIRVPEHEPGERFELEGDVARSVSMKLDAEHRQLPF